MFLLSFYVISRITHTHAHTHTHAYTLTHADLFSPLPSLHAQGGLLVLNMILKNHSFACIALLTWYFLGAVFCVCFFLSVDVLAWMCFHCLIKARDGLRTRIKVL